MTVASSPSSPPEPPTQLDDHQVTHQVASSPSGRDVEENVDFSDEKLVEVFFATP